ncbi:MAG: SBBP repeat-containing protein [Chitinophagaceae bacterium]
MRIILFVFLACFLNIPAFAQSPGWAWARSGQNTSSSLNTCVAIDKDDNVYSVGAFQGSISFGDSTYICQGLQNIYVTKYDKDGKLIWSQFIGGNGKYVANSIVVDRYGSVYVGGATAIDSPNATALWYDMLVVKLNPTGKMLWRKWYGTEYDDVVTAMAIDSKNNLVFTGYFFGVGTDPAIYDSIRIGDFVLNSKGNTDIFIAKMDSSGSVFFAKDIGTKKDENAWALSLLKDDHMVMVGSFYSAITFDNLPQLRSISTGLIVGNSYIVELDSDGVAEWAQIVGASQVTQQNAGGELQCMKLATDSAGNVFVAGNYATCDLKIGSFFLPQPYDDQGNYDMWFAKLDSRGNVLWAKNVGGMEADYLRGIATDKAGNLYVTGEAGNTCVFGSDTIKLPNTAGEYLFTAKYDGSGNLLWYKILGGTYGATGYAVSVNNEDEVVVVGGFADAALAFGKSVVYNTGSFNGFVAKLNKEGVGVPPTGSGQFSISPNPASNTLQLQTQQAGQFTSYQVNNTLGQKVGSGILKSQTEQSIELPELVDGMYYFSLSGRAGVVSRKVFIQH